MFINEIVWYRPGGGIPRDKVARKTDFILHYGFNHMFNRLYEPYMDVGVFTKKTHTNGIDKDYSRGKNIDNLWRITPLRALNGNIDYPTQKPYKLLERIICLSMK